MNCIICEKPNESKNMTLYKFKPVCRKCIDFFKHSVIFYNNVSAWSENSISKPTAISTVEYALNGIDKDDIEV